MWLFQYNKDWNFLVLCLISSIGVSMWLFQYNKDWNRRLGVPFCGHQNNQCGYSNTTRIETSLGQCKSGRCCNQCGYSNTTRIETQSLVCLVMGACNQCGYSNTTRIETASRFISAPHASKSMWLFQYNKDWNNGCNLYRAKMLGINVAIPIQQGLKPQRRQPPPTQWKNQCGYSNTTRIETAS